MTLMTAAAITALLSMSAAQAQDGPYLSEQAARTCIQQRLAELLAERNPNIAADAPLTTCTNDLKAEFKAKGKSYCEAIGYIAWLVADENSKRNGHNWAALSAGQIVSSALCKIGNLGQASMSAKPGEGLRPVPRCPPR